jgi:hypothetical protein
LPQNAGNFDDFAQAIGNRVAIDLSPSHRRNHALC